VLATQNSLDSAGQHLRLSIFLKNLRDNVEKYPVLQTALEVIIIDFNSDMSMPAIDEMPSVTIPNMDHMPVVRVLRVPGRMVQVINQKLGAAFKAEYWEFYAKNIGVRRACGEYVLISNPDAFISSGLWGQLAQRPLNDTFYYRMGRMGTKQKMPPEALTWSSKKAEEFMFEHRDKAVACCSKPPVNYYVDNIADQAWFTTALQPPFLKTDYPPGQMLFDAPGDFTMLSRTAWFTLRGYPEVPMPTQLDDFIIAAARSIGLSAATFNAPAALYHLTHDTNYGTYWTLTYKYFRQTWDPWMQQVWNSAVNQGKFMPYNKEDWGLGDIPLPEYHM